MIFQYLRIFEQRTLVLLSLNPGSVSVSRHKDIAWIGFGFLFLQVGQGTYSNVYKAKDRDTKKIVALKKVRFDTSEPESVKFMAREILVLKKLDHPNVIKLERPATSRMQYSLYLLFDFMRSDLTKIISRLGMKSLKHRLAFFLIAKKFFCSYLVHSDELSIHKLFSAQLFD